MMDPGTIRALEQRAAQKAAREKKEPLVCYYPDLIPETIRNIPNLGSHRPKGWRLVEELFVDSSGFGSEGERAMTQDRFIAWVREHIPQEYGYAIISEGQFQVYVGAFERTDGKKPAKPAPPPKDPPPAPPKNREKDLPPAKPDEVTFGTLTKEHGLVNVRRIKRSDIGKCPHTIFEPEHYREDGSCRCDDPEEQRRLIRTAGYKKSDFPKARK